MKDGSGTLMATPMYVEINSGVKEFRLEYTAATLLRNAVLRIRVPVELLGEGDPADMPLQDLDTSTVDIVDGSIAIGKIGGSDDPRNSSAAGYVYATDRHATTLELDGTNNTIIWHELSLRRQAGVQDNRQVGYYGNRGCYYRCYSGPCPMAEKRHSRDGTTHLNADGVYPFYTFLATSRGRWCCP